MNLAIVRQIAIVVQTVIAKRAINVAKIAIVINLTTANANTIVIAMMIASVGTIVSVTMTMKIAIASTEMMTTTNAVIMVNTKKIAIASITKKIQTKKKNQIIILTIYLDCKQSLIIIGNECNLHCRTLVKTDLSTQ